MVLALLTVEIAIVGAVFCPPVNVTASQPAYGLEPHEMQRLVDAHNVVRAQLSPQCQAMPLLRWNDDLAALALRAVSGCPANATVPPQSQRQGLAGFNVVGENIAAVGANSPVTDAVDAWAAESGAYSYQPCGSPPRAGAACGACTTVSGCGAYLQLAWATTTDVGCAKQTTCDSASRTLVACYYGPGGNIAGQAPYLPGTPAEVCQFPTTVAPAAAGSGVPAWRTPVIAVCSVVCVISAALYYFLQDGCCDRDDDDSAHDKRLREKTSVDEQSRTAYKQMSIEDV